MPRQPWARFWLWKNMTNCLTSSSCCDASHATGRDWRETQLCFPLCLFSITAKFDVSFMLRQTSKQKHSATSIIDWFGTRECGLCRVRMNRLKRKQQIISHIFLVDEFILCCYLCVVHLVVSKQQEHLLNSNCLHTRHFANVFIAQTWL